LYHFSAAALFKSQSISGDLILLRSLVTSSSLPSQDIADHLNHTNGRQRWRPCYSLGFKFVVNSRFVKEMLDLLVETFPMVSQSGATTTEVLWTTAQPENHYD
jgi:hypothetical protein